MEVVYSTKELVTPGFPNMHRSGTWAEEMNSRYAKPVTRDGMRIYGEFSRRAMHNAIGMWDHEQTQFRVTATERMSNMIRIKYG